MNFEAAWRGCGSPLSELKEHAEYAKTAADGSERESAETQRRRDAETQQEQVPRRPAKQLGRVGTKFGFIWRPAS